MATDPGSAQLPHHLEQVLERIGRGESLATGDAELLARRLGKLGEIVDASRSLMGAMDMRLLLTGILGKTRSVMNADKASIFLIDRERNEIFASVTLDGSEIRLPLGSGIIGHVALTGETVNIADAYADQRFNRANDQKSGYRTRSILCMPIRNPASEITGAIQILNRMDESSFDHEDEELLAAFAGMIGVCLENARAYEELAAERNSLEEKVVERTYELAMAKAETDQILNAVEEGLFLLYRSGERFIIGAGHSAALTALFGNTELRSKDFLATIAAFVPAGVAEKTQVFLELMFDSGKNAAMMAKLNPLALVEANFASGKAPKFLRFRFVRAMREQVSGRAKSTVGHLLVTVADATQEIGLEQRLAKTQAENQLHTELIRTILQSDPATLAEFLRDLDTDLESAHAFLHAAGQGQQGALEQLFRIIHSIKGNAAILEFALLSARAHSMETDIENLLKADAGRATGYDRLRVPLAELSELRNEIGNWLSRIESFQENYARQSTGDYLQRALRTVFSKALSAGEKHADLEYSAFDPALVPVRFKKQVKDILVQLARNAAAHGIELPSVRQSAGKPAGGTLSLRSSIKDGVLVITVEDDGAGIDADVLAKKLIGRGALNETEFVRLSPAEKLNLVFAPGISRLDNATQHAGRGVGMSIVTEALAQMGARIQTASEPGQFTRFTMEIPL